MHISSKRRNELIRKGRKGLALFLAVVLAIQCANLPVIVSAATDGGEALAAVEDTSATEQTPAEQTTPVEESTPAPASVEESEPVETTPVETTPAAPAEPSEPAEPEQPATTDQAPANTTPVEAEQSATTETPAPTTEQNTPADENGLGGGNLADNNSAVTAPAEDTTATVALALNQSTLAYEGTTYTSDQTQLEAPANQELKFTVAPTDGFEIDTVKQVAADGAETELTADANGEYTIAADKVADGLKIDVATTEAPAEPAEEPAEGPTDDATTESVEEPATEEGAADENTSPSDEEQMTVENNEGESDSEEGIAEQDVLNAAVDAANSLSSSISLMSISGPQQVDVGSTIRLSSDSPSGGWHGLRYKTYSHQWTASSDAVSLSNTSNDGATVAGNHEGDARISHTWGYYRASGIWNQVGSESYEVSVIQSADDEDLCTITFNLDGGSWNNALAGTHTYRVGHALWEEGKDLTVPSKPGYVFEGWSPSVSRIVTNDATYTAKWKRADRGTTPVYVYLKVTGDTEGLVLNQNGWYTIGVIYLPKSVVPAPTKGATITLTDDVLSAINDALGSIVRYGPNATLNIGGAEWTALKVDAGANDYTGENAWHLDGTIDATVLAGLTVNYINKETGKNINTKYENWTVGTEINPTDYIEDIKNYTYQSIDRKDTFTISKDGNNVINIYYLKNADSLYYNANGGTGEMDPTVGKAEEQVTVEDNKFKRDGYKFTGWNTQSDGGGDSYSVGQQYILTDNRDELFAQWEPDEKQTYLVSYKVEEGGSIAEGAQTENGPIQVLSNDGVTGSTIVVADGYKFDGWYVGEKRVSTDLELSADTAKQNLNKDGEVYTDTVFTAKLNKLYTLTYEWDGLPADTTFYDADGAELEKQPAEPADLVDGQPYTIDTEYAKGTTVYTVDEYGNVKNAYVFSGWDKQSGTIDGANVEAKGSWTTDGQDLRDKYIVADEPTMNGWSFSGWDRDDFTMPAEDILIRGSWTPLGIDEISVTPYVGVYDGQSHGVTVSGILDGDTVEFFVDGQNVENDFTNVIGETSIDVRVIRNGVIVWTGSSTVEITPATIIVTANNLSKTQGQADPALTSTYEGAVAGEIPGWTGYISRAAGEAPGTYPIGQNTLQLADGENGFLESNYTLQFVGATFTINPLPGGGGDGGDGGDGGTTPTGPTPTPTNPTPGPGATTTIATGVATGVIAGALTDDAADAETIDDNETPLASGAETIDDDATPLASGREDRQCWVHWFMFIGMAISAVYYIGALIHRRSFTSGLKNFEDEVLNPNDQNNA